MRRRQYAHTETSCLSKKALRKYSWVASTCSVNVNATLKGMAIQAQGFLEKSNEGLGSLTQKAQRCNPRNNTKGLAQTKPCASHSGGPPWPPPLACRSARAARAQGPGDWQWGCDGEGCGNGDGVAPTFEKKGGGSIQESEEASHARRASARFWVGGGGPLFV